MKRYYGKREVWIVTKYSKNGSIKQTRNTGILIYVWTDLPLESQSLVAKEAGGDILVTPKKPEWPLAVDVSLRWFPADC